MDTAEFDSIIHHLQEDLQTIRTNRANPNIVEHVRVRAYDSDMSIQEVASITVPEPQMLVIQPWDVSIIKNIESALRDTEMQLSPVVDGQIIRIAFPQLTEERRKELVKVVNEKVEQARIRIRKVREEMLKGYKNQEKEGDVSEDEYFRLEKEVQQTVDIYNGKIEQMAQGKEKELMTI